MIEYISLGTNFITGIIVFLLGCKFFLTKNFFPYHSEISKLEWTELDSKMQTLILSLMHAVGACLFPISFILIGGAIKLFFLFDTTTEILLTIMTLILFLGLFRVTFGIYKKTGANTPWKLVSTLIGINALSLVIQLVVN